MAVMRQSRRCRWELVVEFLGIIENTHQLSRISGILNANRRTLYTYIPSMIDGGLIEANDVYGEQQYFLTDKGKMALEQAQITLRYFEKTLDAIDLHRP